MNKEIHVDIGCGPSSSTLDYSSVEGIVVGVDKDLSVLRPNSSVRPGSFSPVSADAVSLPFADSSVRGAYATHVLEHLPPSDENTALKEMNRILEPGGKLTVAVPHPTSERIMSRLVHLYHSPEMHQQVFTPERIKADIEKAGLTSTKAQSRKWFSALVAIMKASLHRLSPDKVTFKPQVGLGMKAQGNIAKGIRRTVEKARNFTERIPYVTPILNKIFPLETYIEAIKPRLIEVDKQ